MQAKKMHPDRMAKKYCLLSKKERKAKNKKKQHPNPQTKNILETTLPCESNSILWTINKL
jgi:hypothetical protein